MACLPLSGSGAFLGATLVSTGEEEQPIRISASRTIEKLLIYFYCPPWGRTCQHKTMRFDGKNIDYYGSQPRIGRAIALRLAAEGSQVVLSRAR